MMELAGSARIVDVGNSVVVKSSEPSARQSFAVSVLQVDSLVRVCVVLGKWKWEWEWECERSVRRVFDCERRVLHRPIRCRENLRHQVTPRISHCQWTPFGVDLFFHQHPLNRPKVPLEMQSREHYFPPAVRARTSSMITIAMPLCPRLVGWNTLQVSMFGKSPFGNLLIPPCACRF